ncbi:hypothetical protein [Nostoc piscinale]|nr:hypothetical protein [Nostoc piscinale]
MQQLNQLLVFSGDRIRIVESAIAFGNLGCVSEAYRRYRFWECRVRSPK